MQADTLPSEPPGKPETNTSMMHWLGIEPGSLRGWGVGSNPTTEAPVQALPYQSSNFGMSDSVVIYSENVVKLGTKVEALQHSC